MLPTNKVKTVPSDKEMNPLELYCFYLFLQLNDIEWVNAKKINDSEPGFVFSEKFRQKVNFNYSSVHIPVEIWEGGKNSFCNCMT